VGWHSHRQANQANQARQVDQELVDVTGLEAEAHHDHDHYEDTSRRGDR
jgi:hypothetical protein